MKRLLLVVNPYTGGARLKNNLLEMVNRFTLAGYQVTVCPTRGPGDAVRYAREQAADCQMVVCCGGDGTLNEVVEGLMHLDTVPTLGYVPCGTTNDFATSLRLPKNNILKATDRILHPRKLFACDVGLFNDRVFNYVAAFGVFADVSYTTPQSAKNALGYFAYLIEAMSKLTTLRSFRVRVASGEQVVEDEFILGMVSNSASVAGLPVFDHKSVHMDDGVFEVLLVRRPQNLGDLGALSTALLAKDFDSPFLHNMCVRQVEITSSEPIDWTLDGEFGGKVGEAAIAVRQKALRVCI